MFGADPPLALHLAIHALCRAAATAAAQGIAPQFAPSLALCHAFYTGARGAASGASPWLPASILLSVLPRQALCHAKDGALQRGATGTVQAGPLLYLCQVMRVRGAELPGAASGAAHSAGFTPCSTAAGGV